MWRLPNVSRAYGDDSTNPEKRQEKIDRYKKRKSNASGSLCNIVGCGKLGLYAGFDSVYCERHREVAMISMKHRCGIVATTRGEEE